MSARPEMNERIKFSRAIQDRIIELQVASHVRNEEVASEIGIPLDTYTNLKRSNDHGEPNRKYVPYWLLHKICEYYDCTYDYIIGESDDAHKDKNGRTITYPIHYLYKGEIYKIHKKLDQLSDDDKVLLIRFLLHTPIGIQKPIISGIRTVIKQLVTDSLSTLIQSSSDVKGFKLDAQTGIHDENYVRTLMTIQKGQTSVSQKRYRDALRHYCTAIQEVVDVEELSFPLINLYRIACGHIRALGDKWEKFPQELKILELIKISDPREYKDENREQLKDIVETLSKRNTENMLPDDTVPSNKRS